eukprot:scaffold12237_cov208-Skeletonema_menzelii.AAC.2
MADHADGDNDGDIFIYRGGRAPLHVTHVRIDKYVDEIEENAFRYCEHLAQVETHDGLRIIGARAFLICKSLRRINLKSAVEIGRSAFYECANLESVEFGGNLETIGTFAFKECSLTHLKLPSIITIAAYAFFDCELVDIELSERLETIEAGAFCYCERLQRIAIPLKRDLLLFDDEWQKYNQFDNCEKLTTVDLVGGIHKTVASLHMESWRNELVAEINGINQVLPNTPGNEKTDVVRQWMEVVIDKMDHCKSEHYRYVKEGVTLLELALWKSKIDEKEEYTAEGETTKKAKVDAESARKERRITCGADIVIKNVFPFLQLD